PPVWRSGRSATGWRRSTRRCPPAADRCERERKQPSDRGGRGAVKILRRGEPRIHWPSRSPLEPFSGSGHCQGQVPRVSAAGLSISRAAASVAGAEQRAIAAAQSALEFRIGELRGAAAADPRFLGSGGAFAVLVPIDAFA